MVKNSFILPFLALIFMAFSFSSQAQPGLNVSINTPANAGNLSESCGGPYELVIERTVFFNDTMIIFLVDIGTAINGLDYNFAPGTFPITLLPGQNVIVIPFEVENDGVPEGAEDLGWTIAYMTLEGSGSVDIHSTIVDEYDVHINSPSDTIQWCRYAPLTLTASSSSAEIHWSPSPAFAPSTGDSVTVRPFAPGWYYASVGSDTCGAVDSIYLDLAIANINNADTVYICNDGDGVVLNGQLLGLAHGFKWIPSDSTLSDTNLLTPVANPTVTSTYILQTDFNVCVTADTVVVRVDSLPKDLHIDIAPAKPYYCAGEIVALFSPSFDSLKFPDLHFNWTPNDGTFLSDITYLNAALQLRDTTTYFRENTNKACMSHDSITINVIPPSVPLSTTDTILCPGSTFRVHVLSNQVMDPEWSPADGLSCTKCLDPNVTVVGMPGTTSIYQFSGTVLGCPVGANLVIQIPPQEEILISGDNIGCDGDTIQLHINNPQNLINFNWQVVFGSASMSCTDCTDPIVIVHGDDPVNFLVSAQTTTLDFCGASGFFQIQHGPTDQRTGKTFLACKDGTVTVNTGDPTLTNVTWSVITGDLSLNDTHVLNPEVTVHSPGKLQYFAPSNDPNFCKVTGPVDVLIFPGDPASFTFSPDTSTEIGQGSEVMVNLVVNASPPTNIMWTVNGVAISANTATITFDANEEVNHVEVTFTNSHGCEQTLNADVRTVPPTWQIPNAFLPGNSEAKNTHFRVVTKGKIFIDKFLIFNRWGQLVYKGPQDDAVGWDGMFKGEPAASDTYVYTAELRFPNGKVEVAKGDVMLLR